MQSVAGGSSWWCLALRIAALAAATGGILLWPRVQPGYGVPFWLWVVGVIGYAISFSRAQRPLSPPGRGVILALCAVLVLAGVLRLVALEDLPANISIDESLTALEALRIAQGRVPNVFSSVGWFSMPNFTFAFPAVFMRLAGADAFFAARLSSVVMGLAGIVCVFALGRRLFGDCVGLLASFLMAVSFWHLHNSRTAFPFVQSSFWTALVLYLQVRARQNRSRALMALAGVTLGLALQCYFPLRILLVIAPLFWVADWYREPVALRTMVVDTVIWGGAALLVLAPLLLTVPWTTLAGHSRDVLVIRPGVWRPLAKTYHVASLPAVVWRNLQESAAMFTDWADVCVLNRSPAGLLDRGTRAALVVGLLVVLWQRRPYGLLVMGWALLTFVFGVALSNAPRASYRLAAAMPALFLMAGIGAEQVIVALTPARGRFGRALHFGLICAAAVWVLRQNYRLFFVDYARGRPGDIRTGQGSDNADSNARRFMLSHCDGRLFYFVGKWLGPPYDPEPKGLDVFCARHRVFAPGGAHARIDRAYPATIFVLVDDAHLLEPVRRCYPSARVTPQRRWDGRLLYWRVDIPVTALGDGGACLDAAMTTCIPSTRSSDSDRPGHWLLLTGY